MKTLEIRQKIATEQANHRNQNSESTMSVNNSQIEDQKTISSLESLDSLKDFMANYNKCKLRESATNMVFSDGNPKSEIMLIGEAPGHDEDIQENLLLEEVVNF